MYMKLKVTVNPNPFTSELAVLIDGHFTLNAVLRLLNSAGNVVRITSCTVNEGNNRLSMDNLGKYASGQYTLEIKLLNGDLLESIALQKI